MSLAVDLSFQDFDGLLQHRIPARLDTLNREKIPADLHAWKGHPLGSLAQGNPANIMKYGMGAMQEYETARGGLAGSIKLESARDSEDNGVSEKWKERKSPWPKA